MKQILTIKLQLLLAFLLFGTTQQTQAQWAGSWNTNLEEIKISANSGQIRFEMGDYIFSGNSTSNATKTNYTLTGNYNLKPTNASRPRGAVIKHHNALGDNGSFTITMDRTQQTFKGEYQNGTNNLKKGEWSGRKINTISTADKQGKTLKKIDQNKVNEVVSEAVARRVNLTGTWEQEDSEQFVRLKIVQLNNYSIKVRAVMRNKKTNKEVKKIQHLTVNGRYYEKPISGLFFEFLNSIHDKRMRFVIEAHHPENANRPGPNRDKLDFSFSEQNISQVRSYTDFKGVATRVSTAEPDMSTY